MKSNNKFDTFFLSIYVMKKNSAFLRLMMLSDKDRQVVRVAANFYNSCHRTTYPINGKKDLGDRVPHLINSHDRPMCISQCVAYFVCEILAADRSPRISVSWGQIQSS